jgi:hypothetical protein
MKMLKKVLFVVAAVAMLAVTVQAGEVQTKVHAWPMAPVPVEITQIPVFINAGFYISVEKNDYKIKLAQLTGSKTKYEGCVTIKVKANFVAILTATITPTKKDTDGDGVADTDVLKNTGCCEPWTVTLNGIKQVCGGQGVEIPAGCVWTEVIVCAQANCVDLCSVEGGKCDIRVATVSIFAVPAITGTVTCI